MHTRLLKGIPAEELEQAKSLINGLLLDKGMEYLVRAIELQRRDTRDADYDSPSWAYKQAHDNGYNQALGDVLKLIQYKE